MPDRYNATPNGIRLLNRFKYDTNLDETSGVFVAETFYEKFMMDLNTYKL